MLLEPSFIVPFIVQCFVLTVTPGPNNLTILASAMRYGRKEALSPYLGICLGFPIMVLIVAGVVAFVGGDILQNLGFVKYVGAAFLLFIAYKIFTASATDTSGEAVISFWQMFFFQWVNPKAWAMVISTVSVIGVQHFYLPALSFFIVAFPATGVWLIGGAFIGARILGTRYEVIANRIMGVIMALSIFFIL